MSATGGKRPGRRGGRNSTAAAEAKQNGPGNVEATAGGRVLMDLDFVRGLIAAVDESGIDSLEIYRA
ncbi:MAG: hypothetical protein GWN71_15830, partial [Gammaproteobacteria bacterium]|nr:hypothetical protein [Gemmatimonadota bacterium]NIU74995.1 hypothetical protein [Gammaproteobacteria bacterium]